MCDATVPMFAGHLEGKPCPDRVQRIRERYGGDASTSARNEFVGMLDVVRIGGNDGA